MKIKKPTMYLFYIVSILSLVYFTIKYYSNQVLNFDGQDILGWTIIVVVILITLGIGIFNMVEIKKVKQQNVELLTLTKELCERQESTCEEVLVTLHNSREISMDILNEICRINRCVQVGGDYIILMII